MCTRGAGGCGKGGRAGGEDDFQRLIGACLLALPSQSGLRTVSRRTAPCSI